VNSQWKIQRNSVIHSNNNTRNKFHPLTVPTKLVKDSRQYSTFYLDIKIFNILTSKLMKYCMRNGYIIYGYILYILCFCIMYFCDLFHTVATWTKFWINRTHNAFINKSVHICICTKVGMCVGLHIYIYIYIYIHTYIYILKLRIFILFRAILKKFRKLKCYSWKFRIHISCKEGQDFETRHVYR